jgi:hypothetical protein
MSTAHPRSEFATAKSDDRALVPAEPLADAIGPIPTFLPRAVDEHGRLVPLSTEQRRARAEAAMRALTAVRELPDEDPPDTLSRLMRGIDENRPRGRKLFEGMS